MKKAGGIIGIIAGVFGIFAAFSTLLLGGVGAAFDAEGGDLVIALGWGGVIFSFLTIIFGALSISATSKVNGILLIISSILGMVLGGSFVAIFMLLALIGGILAVIGASKNEV